jgi:hypothetical protein
MQLPDPPQVQPSEQTAKLVQRLLGPLRDGWASSDLPDILRDQLAAPLPFRLPDTASGAGTPAFASFAELLFHPGPPLALLHLTKQFARRCGEAKDGPLPLPITKLLYYAAIAVAWARHGKWITTQNAEKVREAFERASKLTWVDEATRTIFVDALARLDESAPRPHPTQPNLS